MLSPSVDYHEGPLGRIPAAFVEQETVSNLAQQAVAIAQADWNAKERSWAFSAQRLLSQGVSTQAIAEDFNRSSQQAGEPLRKIQEIEECINKILIEGLGLQEELDFRIPAGKITSDQATAWSVTRIDQLKDDIEASATTVDRKAREKERAKLLRQQEELRAFDERLRHYADQRIAPDLDDGARVNYGDLLAAVKAVTAAMSRQAGGAQQCLTVRTSVRSVPYRQTRHP